MAEHSKGHFSDAKVHAEGFMAMLGMYLQHTNPLFGPFMMSLADEIRLFISLGDPGSVSLRPVRNATFTH